MQPSDRNIRRSAKEIFLNPIRCLVRTPQRFLLRHGRLRWAVPWLFPPRLTARIIRWTGLEYVSLNSNPNDVARQYAEAASRLVAGDTNSYGKGRILIDITAIGGYDHRTGVQRASRALIRQMSLNPHDGYSLSCIYRLHGDYYCADGSQTRVDAKPGDIFLGLDLDIGMDDSARNWLRTAGNRGVSIHFVIYDILPLLRPEWFSPYNYPVFRVWLEGVAGVADSLVCISKTVATEVNEWLDRHKVQRKPGQRIEHFYLGADLDASYPSIGISAGDQQVLAALEGEPSILMVGTIEPRKGYLQALEAFELLWAGGVDARLVIVGKEGWAVASLARRLRSHSETQKRLFWLEHASDEMLERLYDHCTGFLAASQGEGFGLPIIEAARHHLPIMARDLPVFKELAGRNAFYFSGTTGRQLADALRIWLKLIQDGTHPQPDGIAWVTWEESARQLLSVILGRSRLKCEQAR